MDFLEFTDLGFSLSINPNSILAVEAEGDDDDGRVCIHMVGGTQFYVDQSYNDVLKALMNARPNSPPNMFHSVIKEYGNGLHFRGT